MDARLDKFFFQNLVKYNEQPYGELVAANFFELDFSPQGVNHHGTFNTLREKIVLDLTVKVLQVQQLDINGTGLVTPNLPGLTPPVSPLPRAHLLTCNRKILEAFQFRRNEADTFVSAFSIRNKRIKRIYTYIILRCYLQV